MKPAIKSERHMTLAVPHSSFGHRESAMRFGMPPILAAVNWFLLVAAYTVIFTLVAGATAVAGLDQSSQNHRKIMRDLMKDCRNRNVATLPHKYYLPGICEVFVCTADFADGKKRAYVSSQGCRQFMVTGRCQIQPGDKQQKYPECCSKVVCT